MSRLFFSLANIVVILYIIVTMMKSKFFSKLNLISIGVGAPVGAFLGWLYYKLIGCRTGTCPLTSSPGIMLVYGAIVGGILASLVSDLIANRKKVKAE